MDRSVFFDSWSSILRVVVLAPLSFATLVMMLRVSGKRSIAKMNTFDFVFVVALGSSLANVVVSRDISLLTGLSALAALLATQMLFAWMTTRSNRAERIINGEPALLFHRGQFLWKQMKREKVTEEEILAAVRSQGVGSLDEVAAVVLETDGLFSVVQKEDGRRERSSLRDIPEWSDRPEVGKASLDE